MKRQLLFSLGSAALLLSNCCFPLIGAENPPHPARPAIYDESADGAKQIDEALAQARKMNKRVLVQFGANWCGWCHKLHKLFDSDPDIAARLRESYIVVMVDVNKDHNNATNKR